MHLALDPATNDIGAEEVSFENSHDADVQIYFPDEVIELQIEQGISLLAAWRTYRGLSQADLAVRLGVSLNTIMVIEQSDYPFTRQRIYLLADVLRRSDQTSGRLARSVCGSPHSLYHLLDFLHAGFYVG